MNDDIEQFKDDEELVDLTQESVEEEQTEEVEEKEVNLPEKFKGKSIEDVVNSYLELEKAYGQRANDIGEYRKLTDQLLEQQLNNKKPVEEDIFDVDTLLENPEEAVSKLVEKKTKSLEDKLLQYERAEKQKVFEQKHPDFRDVVQTPEFAKWIQASPVRQKMFLEADKNYDYETGDEILSLYKELHQVKSTQSEQEQKTVQERRKKQLKQASVETGSIANPSKKVYSRKQLIHLKITNPAKYDSMLPEIKLAYAEGRVKD